MTDRYKVRAEKLCITNAPVCGYVVFNGNTPMIHLAAEEKKVAILVCKALNAYEEKEEPGVVAELRRRIERYKGYAEQRHVDEFNKKFVKGQLFEAESILNMLDGVQKEKEDLQGNAGCMVQR